MNDGGPYKLFWIGLGRWRLSIRFRPDWHWWIQRTDLLLLGVGTEEGL
jgi:hypothetical protein